MKKLYFLLFVLVVLSCGKKDEPNVGVGVLTAPPNGWIIVSEIVAFSDNASGPTDVFKNADACEKDDAVVFFTDGTLRVDHGVTCNQSEQATSSGTWTIAKDDSQLTVTSSMLNITAMVVDIESGILKLTATSSDPNGGSDYSITITLTPKV